MTTTVQVRHFTDFEDTDGTLVDQSDLTPEQAVVAVAEYIVAFAAAGGEVDDVGRMFHESMQGWMEISSLEFSR